VKPRDIAVLGLIGPGRDKLVMTAGARVNGIISWIIIIEAVIACPLLLIRGQVFTALIVGLAAVLYRLLIRTVYGKRHKRDDR
jgi:hypothetical protein